MSTLKADAVTTKSDNTDLTITGGGTGVPNLESGFKVGGSAGVPTASIRDDAVTLAKLAAGTDGELITWDASGDPAAVAVGTATHVLTSNGAGAAPTFQAAAGGGAWTLIASNTASASATLEVSGMSATYDTYALVISALRPATDDRQLFMRFGDSSGFDSAADDYDFHTGSVTSGSHLYSGLSGDDTYDHIIVGSGTGGDANQGFSATYYIHSPGDGNTINMISGVHVESTNVNVTQGGHFVACRNTAITMTQLQVYFSSGNITTGRMTLYGVSHA